MKSKSRANREQHRMRTRPATAIGPSFKPCFGCYPLPTRCIMEFIEDLSPAQLRALLPKVISAIRSRRASLLAELESMGGQAPTTADFPVPSRDELEREANAAALQQLILRIQSQWQEERASLRAAIEGARSERVRAPRPPAASGGQRSKRRRLVETLTPCGEGASLGEMYQKLVLGNASTFVGSTIVGSTTDSLVGSTSSQARRP